MSFSVVFIHPESSLPSCSCEWGHSKLCKYTVAYSNVAYVWLHMPFVLVYKFTQCWLLTKAKMQSWFGPSTNSNVREKLDFGKSCGDLDVDISCCSICKCEASLSLGGWIWERKVDQSKNDGHHHPCPRRPHPPLGRHQVVQAPLLRPPCLPCLSRKTEVH